MVADAALAERIGFLQNAVGAVGGPFDSFLALRGLKTLPLRMRQSSESALAIAAWLERHPRVERVRLSRACRRIRSTRSRMRQMKNGRSGIVTFFLKGGLPEARRFLERLELFTLAESLGGVESLVDHPAIMTHASVPPEARAKLGITRFAGAAVGRHRGYRRPDRGPRVGARLKPQPPYCRPVSDAAVLEDDHGLSPDSAVPVTLPFGTALSMS